MLMEDCDLLILDEPTNHLDLPSREQLEETLTTFSGTLLIVSHDHYLIERLCNKLLVIDDKVICRKEAGRLKQSEHASAEKKIIKENLMVVEMKLAAVLSELSLLIPGDSRFEVLDQEFKKLVEQKNILNRRKG